MRTLGIALLGLWIGVDARAAETLPRTLFIGDSQSCETFGATLDLKLRQAARGQVWTRGRWGGSPHDFYGHGSPSTTTGFFDHDPEKDPVRGKIASFPHFPALLSDLKPGLVVVELGANLTWSIGQPDFIKKTVGRMIDDIKAAGARCFWIGPSASRSRPNVRELQRILIDVVDKRCAYFDSIPVTPYPSVGGDGLHFDSLGAPGRLLGERWGKAAYRRIDQCVREIRQGHGMSPTPDCLGF